MRRREFIQALLAASVAPKLLLAQQSTSAAPLLPAPVPWTLGLNPKTPLPHTAVVDSVATTDSMFFSPQQMATLERLADVLVPATAKHPGALQAETPAFLDFLIGHSPASRAHLYTGGLDWLDTQAKLKYKKPFAKLDASEADALLKPWLRTWMQDHPPTELHADFINIAHADIRAATANSRAWSMQDDPGDESAVGLYWSPIEPDIYAERSQSIHHRPSNSIAAPKASHTQRSYAQ
jgi:hypothetical protein